MPSTVSRERVLERVCMHAASYAGVDAAEVTERSRYGVDLNFDSMSDVEFVIAVEEEFGLSLPDEQIERVETIGQTVDLILPAIQRKTASTR